MERIRPGLALGLALGLGGCRGPQPDPGDRFVVLGYSEADARVWRVDLATGVGEGSIELTLVDDPAQLHGDLALLGDQLVDADGHGLSLGGEGLGDFALAPNRRLVAATGCEPDRICVAHLGHPFEAVAAGDDFAWAADSASLLVIHDGDGPGHRRLETVALGVREPRPLAEVDFAVGAVTPMPDGSWWILTWAEDALWRVDPGSGAATLVHALPGPRHVLGPAFASGDQAQAVFISSADNDCLAGDIWIAGFDGLDPRRTTTSTCSFLSPNRGVDPKLIAPLPDARFVAMVSGKDECKPSLGTHSLRCEDELYVLDPSQGTRRRVTQLDFGAGLRASMIALAMPD